MFNAIVILSSTILRVLSAGMSGAGQNDGMTRTLPPPRRSAVGPATKLERL